MDNHQLPPFITQYFWGDDLKELNLSKNQKYIIQTLLERGNTDALRWLFHYIDKKTIKDYLPTLKLSKKSARFWNLYLS